MDAQMVPTIKAVTGIINHSKTFMDLATIPFLRSAFDVQSSLDADPSDCAVDKALLLPNRHPRLHFIDEFLACGEGLAAVSRRNGDNDRKIADRKQPRAMDGGNRDRMVFLRHLLGYIVQHRDRVGMRLVAQRTDAAAIVGGPNRSDEDGRATRGGIGYSGHDLVDR